MAAAFQAPARPIKERELGNTLVLFDVDGTLTPARRSVSHEMLGALAKLREKAVVGFVGGSDLHKIEEQLSIDGVDAVQSFDYGFAENGLTAWKSGKQLASQSFIKHLGEEDYKKLVNYILRYVADLDIPIKRGTFVEFRNGMVNVSPIGRNATVQERHDFEAYDKTHNLRKPFVAALQKEFAHLSLTYSIGGQISFDIFPTGWDKTYCLQHVEKEGFKEIHFFGDKTYEGGNDYEIFTDERTIGHSVKGPEDTENILQEMFKL